MPLEVVVVEFVDDDDVDERQLLLLLFSPSSKQSRVNSTPLSLSLVLIISSSLSSTAALLSLTWLLFSPIEWLLQHSYSSPSSELLSANDELLFDGIGVVGFEEDVDPHDIKPIKDMHEWIMQIKILI